MKQIPRLLGYVLIGAFVGAIVLAICARIFLYSPPVGDSTDEVNNIANLVIPIYGALYGLVLGGILGAIVWLVRRLRTRKAAAKV